MSEQDKKTQMERRSNSDGSYEGEDRRRMSYGVLYTCYGTIGEVEDWLDDHCQEEFHLVIEEMDEDLIRKSLKIMFDSEVDKMLFINDFAKKN